MATTTGGAPESATTRTRSGGRTDAVITDKGLGLGLGWGKFGIRIRGRYHETNDARFVIVASLTATACLEGPGTIYLRQNGRLDWSSSSRTFVRTGATKTRGLKRAGMDAVSAANTAQ
jgi:hypothetical protein